MICWRRSRTSSAARAPPGAANQLRWSGSQRSTGTARAGPDGCADLGNNDSVREMVRAAVTAHGGLDILHNKAAATRLAATRALPVSAAAPDVWDETMRVNLRGALVAIQAAVPHMIARGGGSVINTASGAGLTGDLRNPAYGASKAALISLTRYVATEFGKQGIRCNAISPGFIVIPEKPGRDAVDATML